MLIRDYQSEDEEGWLRCRVLAFLHTAYYDDVYQKKGTYSNPSIELVAVEQSEIVGLIDVEYEKKVKTVCSECTSLGGMIWHIAVHPDFQRQGIGQRLLTDAEKKLKERHIFQLEAYTRDDKSTNSWYRKNGFHESSHYLHIFMDRKEMKGKISSPIEDLKPITCFAHYTGKNTEKIKKEFNRVHECRCYRKNTG